MPTPAEDDVQRCWSRPRGPSTRTRCWTAVGTSSRPAPGRRSPRTTTPFRPRTGSAGRGWTASGCACGPQGSGTLLVYRSTARGSALRVDAREVERPVRDRRRPARWTPFVDGGWYWFDLVAGLRGAAAGAGGLAQVGPDGAGRATRRRRSPSRSPRSTGPAFCLNLLRQLAAATAPGGELDGLVDQVRGRRPGHAAPAGPAGLRRRARPRWPAGCGCSRSATSAGPAASPAACSRRWTTVAARTSCCWTTTWCSSPRASPARWRSPTWRAGRSSWAATCSACTPGRCCTRSPRRSPAGRSPGTRPRRPGTTTTCPPATCAARPGCTAGWTPATPGWWMCLMPVAVLREVGLSLPFFIKWDDAEYGLRARAHGVPTVSLPGAAVWHVPWTDKDDAVDWQAYYHARNRVVAALLHSPFPHGGRLLARQPGGAGQAHRGAAVLGRRAADPGAGGRADRAAPPARPARLAAGRAVRDLRAGFTDARVAADAEDFPPVAEARPRRRETVDRRPTEPGRRRWPRRPSAWPGRRCRADGVRAVQPAARAGRSADAGWWSLGRLDSALVSTTDGTGVSWHRRDRAVGRGPVAPQRRRARPAASRVAAARRRPTARRCRTWSRVQAWRRDAGRCPTSDAEPTRWCRVSAGHEPAGRDPDDRCGRRVGERACSTSCGGVTCWCCWCARSSGSATAARSSAWRGPTSSRRCSSPSTTSGSACCSGQGARVPHYAVYLFAGLVAVNAFSEAVGNATRSVVANADLVRKVYLPRELFPVSSLCVAGVHLLPQLLVLTAGALVAGWRPDAVGLLCAVGCGAPGGRPRAGPGAGAVRPERVLPRRREPRRPGAQSVVVWTSPVLYATERVVRLLGDGPAARPPTCRTRSPWPCSSCTGRSGRAPPGCAGPARAALLVAATASRRRRCSCLGQWAFARLSPAVRGGAVSQTRIVLDGRARSPSPAGTAAR